MTQEEQELKQAIRQKCMDCCGGMRREVERCTISSCPLYPYRKAEAQAKAPEPPDRRQISIDEYIRRVT